LHLHAVVAASGRRLEGGLRCAAAITPIKSTLLIAAIGRGLHGSLRCAATIAAIETASLIAPIGRGLHRGLWCGTAAMFAALNTASLGRTLTTRFSPALAFMAPVAAICRRIAPGTGRGE
jgi:hypothetical protein